MGNIDSESRLEFLLVNWANWMRHGGQIADGYPYKSYGLTEYGDNSIRDMEDTADNWIATAIDAIIQDLPDQERSAINHQYLDSRYRYQIVFYAATLYNAKKLVQAGIDRKGIW